MAAVVDECRAWSAFVQEGRVMLHYALVFLIVAIVAAALGFGGFIGGAAALTAKVLFVAFLILAIVSFLRRAK
jgi:uncharacterized membrane protein YtjA (UPF0391 family)